MKRWLWVTKAAGQSAPETLTKPDTWQLRFRHNLASCRSLHLLQHQDNNSHVFAMGRIEVVLTHHNQGIRSVQLQALSPVIFGNFSRLLSPLQEQLKWFFIVPLVEPVPRAPQRTWQHFKVILTSPLRPKVPA